MNRRNYKRNEELFLLVNEYEEMEKKGAVCFLEKMAFKQLLNFYEEENKVDRALEVVEHALHQHGFSEDFFIRKAQLLLQKNKPSEALSCCEQASLFAPGEVEAYLLKVEAYVRLRQMDNAWNCLETARNNSHTREDLSETYLVEAFLWESREDYKRMFRCLRRSLLLNPKNELALDRIWMCVEMAQNYEASVKLHQKLIDKDAFNAVAWYNLGHAYSNLDDLEAAAEAFEFSLTIDSSFEFAYREAIQVQLEAKNFKRALELCLELSEIISPDSELMVFTGNCYEYLQQLEEAIRCYREAIRLNPLDDRAWYQLGECLFEKEEWTQSIEAFNKALMLDDRKEEYFAALAEAYFQKGDDEKAEFYFARATEIAPEQAEYWAQLASFLIDIHAPLKALQVLDEAGLYTSSSEFIYCRIAALMQSGRRKEALSLLPDALTHSAEQSNFLFSLLPEMEEDAEVLRIFSMYGRHAG